MKEAIRLTNKTAMALRKSALRLRSMYFAAAVLLSVLLGALGVFLGFLWLPAVPLMIVGIALMDCALMILSRSQYLALLGQAICTEAAAREIRADKSEKKRRERAMADLMRMKSDMDEPPKPAKDAQPFFEAKQEDLQEDPEEEQHEAQETVCDASGSHRRRRQANLQLIKSSEAK